MSTLGQMMPEVLVADVGTDAAWDARGVGVLAIRPGQSFESAVTAVQRVRPDIHPDLVRDIVRRHLPDALDLSSIATVTVLPSPRPHETSAYAMALKHARLLLVIAVLVISCLLLSAWQLASGIARSNGDAGVAYRQLTDLVHLDCKDLGSNRAQCVDLDGTVMIAESAGLRVTLSWGIERVTAIKHTDTAEAQSWARNVAVQRLFPSRMTAQSWAMFGTDVDRLAAWAERIETAHTEGAR